MNLTERILLLKMDHIGDALWSFPAIRFLRTTRPTARIDMLCTPYLAEAFHHLDSLNQIIHFDYSWSATQRWSVLRQLRRSHYDAAIVLGPVDKVNHLAYLSGAKERWGYAYSGNVLRNLPRNWFMTWHQPHPADVAAVTGIPLPHEVTVMIDLVAQYTGQQTTDSSLFFPLRPEETALSLQQLRSLHPDKSSFAVLHLCAKAFSHGWNEDFFTGLVDRLIQVSPDIGWVITTGPAEQPYLEAYRKVLLPWNLPVISGLSLGQIASLLASSRLLVSWDTGVIHLATAVETPVVDIFPVKDFAYCLQRWGPWFADSESICQNEPLADNRTTEKIVQAVMRRII